MKNNNWNWGDSVIHSRDIINEFEDLQKEHDDLLEALEEAQSELKFLSNSDESSLVEYKDAENTVSIAQDAYDKFDLISFETLKSIVEQGENTSDWGDGALIHEDYFTEYTEQLINDCYEIPKEFESGQWPYYHGSIDYESAAEELKSDYTTIDAEGDTYYIRP